MPKFVYTGEKSALNFRDVTFHKDKPYETDNETFINALRAREEDVGDIREVKDAKPSTKKDADKSA